MRRADAAGETPGAEPDALETGGVRFRDSRFEADFQAWQFAAMRGLAVAVAGALTVIGAVNLAVDLGFRQGGAVARPVFLLRLLAIGISLATLIALVRDPREVRTRRVTEVFVAGFLCLSLGVTLAHGNYDFIGPISQIGTLFAVYLLCPFPWRRQLAYTLVYSLIGLGGWAYKLGFSADFFRILLWIGFAHAAGGYVARQRHRHERQLFASQRRLTRRLDDERRQQEQQAAIVDLLTHELRNPLTVMQAQADLIQRLDDPVEMREAAEVIARSSARSAALIADWVEGDRIATARQPRSAGAEPVAPLEVVRDAAAEVGRRYPECPIRIVPSIVPPVRIERRLLALAVLNVLDNAARYGGSDRGVEIRFRMTSHRLTIRVRDFGPGLSPTDQERILQKHVRLEGARRRQEGTGVGLYLVREMLDRCGAQLRVQSIQGRGSAFLIEVKISK